VISTGAPANIGSLTTTDDEHYAVTIINGTDPGAADVGSMVLRPTDNHHSSLAGGEISGDLTGPLALLKDTSGNGGDITGWFTIGGDASGTISVPKISGALIIEGNASSLITVSDKLYGGGLWVQGETLSTADIRIADMESDGMYGSIVELEGGLAGDLVLDSGIPAGQFVELADELTSTGSIDLNGGDVAGMLDLYRGGAGMVVNGGTVTGTGKVFLGLLGSFSGDATFSAVSNGGDVEIGGNLSGDLYITNDMAGDVTVGLDVQFGGLISVGGDVTGIGNISVDDDLLSGGLIAVGGDVTADGVISIGDDCLGDVTIIDELLGRVNISNDLSGDVYIKGDVTKHATYDNVDIGGELKSTGRVLVSGLCDGTITVGQETEALSLIHLLEGIDDDGSIIINDDKGSYSAHGTIHVGPTSWTTLPDITFDGSIWVKDAAGGGEGDLKGAINVVGCHATADDLDICIDADGEENITITQLGCTYQVAAVCGG
jgi:hypothetical protein